MSEKKLQTRDYIKLNLRFRSTTYQCKLNLDEGTIIGATEVSRIVRKAFKIDIPTAEISYDVQKVSKKEFDNLKCDIFFKYRSPVRC